MASRRQLKNARGKKMVMWLLKSPQELKLPLLSPQEISLP